MSAAAVAPALASRPVLFLNRMQPEFVQLKQACPSFENYCQLVEDPFSLDDNQPMPQIRTVVNNGSGGKMAITRTGLAKCIQHFKAIEHQVAQARLQQQQQNPGGTSKPAAGGKDAPQGVGQPPSTPGHVVSQDSTGTILGGAINFSVTPPGGYNDDKMSRADIEQYLSQRHAEDSKMEETQHKGQSA
jgi:hypothetical protein